MEATNSLLQVPDFSHAITAIDAVSQTLNGFLTVLIFIAKFLFLSVWGWIIILIGLISMTVMRIRNKDGQITFYSVVGGLTETLLWIFTNTFSVVIGLFIVLLMTLLFNGIKNVTDVFAMMKDRQALETVVKNLKIERKVLEVTVVTVSSNTMQANLKYFAYSPVKNADVMTGEKQITIAGQKLFVDFGVINFAYTLIEKGEAVNIAFPNKIYSESVAYQDGASILAADKSVPLSFKLADDDLYLVGGATYDEQIAKIFDYATNATKARKLGLRTVYGQAITVLPQAGKAVEFYSTAVGGVLAR